MPQQSKVGEMHFNPYLTRAFGVILKITVIVFVAETAIMVGMMLLDPSKINIVEVLLDSTLLVVFTSPVIYFWVISPW